MKEQRTYWKVSTYNETPINDVETFESVLKRDLFVKEQMNANKHGMIIEVTEISNKEFNFFKEERKVIVNF